MKFGNMKLNLEEFKISSLKDNTVIVIIGRRGSGKSVLTREILWHKKHLPIGTVISPTEEASPFFSEFIPKIFIHSKYTHELGVSVMARQLLVTKKARKEIKKNKTTDINPMAFLVMDDCLATAKSWNKDDAILQIFMNGRHYKLTYILTMQHALGIPPALRTNLDYVFIFQEDVQSNRRRIYDHYAGIFPSYECFCSVLDQTTEDYGCLVIDNTSRSNKLQNRVFWYKAEWKEDFRLGHQKFWEDQDNDGSSSDSSEEEFDVNNIKKRRGPEIKVNKKARG